MKNRAYKTLRNVVLAGAMTAVGSGCVITPSFATYGAHIANPGNAHFARAHGAAVVGDQGYRLAKAKENNYGYNSKEVKLPEGYTMEDIEWQNRVWIFYHNKKPEFIVENSTKLLEDMKMKEGKFNEEDYRLIHSIRDAAKKKLRLKENKE